MKSFKKVLAKLLVIVLTTLIFALSASALTQTEIRHLKNPYFEQAKNNSELVDGSSEYLRFNGLYDRFELCKGTGMIVFIGLANHVAVMKAVGEPETSVESMQYMARKRGLTYPFNAKEIAETSERSVEKLAIEMGWKYPGSSDAHLEKIAPIYWDECLKLPITVFEAEWIVFDI